MFAPPTHATTTVLLLFFWNSNKVLYYFYGECHTPFLQSGAVFGAGIFLVVLYVRIGSGMMMAEDRR